MEFFDHLINRIIRNDLDEEYKLKLQFRLQIDSIDHRINACRSFERRAPYMNLEHIAYKFFVEILTTVLDLSLSFKEYAVIREVFYLSRSYGMMTLSAQVNLAVSLQSHPAFSLIEYWLDTTQYLVMNDMVRWERSSIKESYPGLQPLVAMNKTSVFVLFIICRIQSSITSMQFLRLEFDTIRGYFNRICEIYSLPTAGIDATWNTASSFIAWLIRTAVGLSERSHRAFVTFSVRDLQALSPEGSLANTCGYCPLLELILSICERYATRNGPTFDSYDGSSSPCICGGSVGQWRAMGAEEVSDESDYRVKVPAVMCERCFRQVFSNPLRSDGMYPILGYCVLPRVTPLPPREFKDCFIGVTDGLRIDFMAVRLPVLPALPNVKDPDDASSDEAPGANLRFPSMALPDLPRRA